VVYPVYRVPKLAKIRKMGIPYHIFCGKIAYPDFRGSNGWYNNFFINAYLDWP
jgi:hypothetical protein